MIPFFLTKNIIDLISLPANDKGKMKTIKWVKDLNFIDF